MTADAERGIKDMTVACGRMVYRMVGSRGLFIGMAIQTIYLALVGVHDDLVHRAACCDQWVDITAGIMTGNTTAIGQIMGR